MIKDEESFSFEVIKSNSKLHWLTTNIIRYYRPFCINSAASSSESESPLLIDALFTETRKNFRNRI